MRPLGMGGRRKKLSDLFVDLGFDAFDKADAWVLASPDSAPDDGPAAQERASVCCPEPPSHIWALIGRRIDESVRIIPGRTQQILRFTSQQ